MSAISLRGLTRTFGSVRAVDGVDLDVEAGTFLALVGPSGCGKTTTLRLIAGLDVPDGGSITVGDQEVVGPSTWVPPERRRIGIVPQRLALFPHLTVAGNVAYGLKGRPKADRERRVGELLALLELDGLADRHPHQLSGGQAQRVSLARALAPRPAVVLLDEPFASLDAHLRRGVREMVRSAIQAEGATAILVTHDQEEALSTADVVAVMLAGEVAQVGPPVEVYQRPSTLAVGRFLGDAVVLDGEVAGGVLRTAVGSVEVEHPDGAVSALFRPEHLALEEGGTGGTVRSVAYLGFEALATVDVAGEVLQVRVGGLRPPEPGASVGVRLGPPSLVVPRASPGNPL